ncbi:MAG: AAA family ATPase [candidate division KSB1 bacterium]|nr:AAA family ATPase [candidate division KSB1 bacterium]MDZ7318081.1 AAA family ATPase [candidate division KSB1 bacterium]MDZ7340436.1 AAA family ATPase [candidate division KSB1 bacterium]
MSSKVRELPPEKLRYNCDPNQFVFRSTADLTPLDEVIGQERAVAAIDFGVDLKSYGYNIFAVGPAGAGRTSTITEAVQKRAQVMPVPDDWCYVFNFRNPDQPNALRLPAGQGRVLQKSMEQLIAQLKKDIPQVSNSEEYKKQQQAILQNSRDQQNRILAALDERLKQRGFTLRKVATGLVLVPMINGQMITPEQFDQLPQEEKDRLEKVGAALQEELNEEFETIHKLERETKAKLEQHERRMMQIAIRQPLKDIHRQFEGHDEVPIYLKEVEDDVLNHIADFLAPPAESEAEAATPSSAGQVTFDRYRVNLIVDNSDSKGAPVIVEPNPTYNNLIGRIDRISKMGILITDYSLIKAGSLHKANGGFLIIEAEQLFQSPLAWKALKRALKNQSIVITDLSEEYSYVSVKTLEPEPIPLNVKVIIIGSYRYYYALLNYDDEFPELFKVKADFNIDMPLTRQNIQSYARFIRNQCEAKQLHHFDPEAVSRVVEYGVFLTGDQKKLSTRFSDIQDLLVEADYIAQKHRHSLVSGADVQQAIAAREYRLNKYEARVRESIIEGTIFIATDGEKVGEVNGLSVIDIGDYAFGKPTRISVQTYLGRSGVIDIEREVKLSGPLHSKGVLILSGYLNGMFGQQRQLSMSASITFEQNYDSIDGDSASSTELYALLSSLSGFPIKQGIAVTGSVNQLGEIQPIGGVTEKIEGFFHICKERGLTGEQGVIIPKSNVRNLMLKAEVIQAVREGKFHIYPVATVDEGISILTGKKAGKRQANGRFPRNSVFGAVEKRLEELAEQWKNQDRSSNKEANKEKKEPEETNQKQEDQEGSSE